MRNLKLLYALATVLFLPGLLADVLLGSKRSQPDHRVRRRSFQGPPST
jgi:hypothetical protein